MSNETIARLQQERADRVEFVTQLLADVESEERSLTETEVANVDAARERCDAIDQQLEPLIQFEESRSAAAELNRRVRQADSKKAVAVQQTRDVSPLGSFRSIGSAFVASDEFRAAGGGAMRDRFVVDRTFGEILGRTANGLEGEPVNTTEPVGSLMLGQPGRYVVSDPTPQFALSDNVTRTAVTQNSMEIVRYGSPDGAQQFEWVPEASSTETGLKPFVELTASVDTIVLEIVAGLLDVTRSFLQDGGAAVRSMIDNQLWVGLKRTVDNKCGEVLTGGTYQTVQGQDWNEAIRLAMAQCELQGYPAQVILAHPSTAAQIDLNLMGLLGGLTALPSAFSPYGLKVITSPVLNEDEVLVGSLNQAMTLFERTGVEMYITDSDVYTSGPRAGTSKFQANVMTLLAEQRCLPVLVQPAALVSATVAAPTP